MSGRGNVDGILMGEVPGLEAQLLTAVAATSLVAAGVEAQKFGTVMIAPGVITRWGPCASMQWEISSIS